WYTEDYTLLHQAAHLGDSRAIEWLLEAGANPHAVTKNKQTPLFFAARKGHTDAVRVLLKAMNNVVRPADIQDTPLHTAAKFGKEETVALLLKSHETDANVRCYYGFRPIHWAAAGGYLKIVQALLPKTDIYTPEETLVPSPFHL